MVHVISAASGESQRIRSQPLKLFGITRPDSYPEWQNFPFAPNNHYGFFFLRTLPSTIAFKLEYVLYYEFYAKIAQFAVKNCLVRPKSLAENDIKTDVNKASTSRFVLRPRPHPWVKTTLPYIGQLCGNSGWVCKKRMPLCQRDPLKFPWFSKCCGHFMNLDSETCWEKICAFVFFFEISRISCTQK